MTFRVGMKVVCVDDRADVLGRPVPFRKGEVCTIGEISKTGSLGLVEYPNGDLHTYRQCRFRPAVEPKQEVSFTQGADPDSERHDNRRRVIEPMPVDGWRVGV